MPGHCEPWPGNTNTVLPTGWARPVTTPATGCPPARSASRRSSCAPSAPTITARCSNRDRVDTSDQPTSSTRTPGSAFTRASSRAAWFVNASAERAESTHGTTTSPPWGAMVSGSYCSTMTCALVPLMPNDETPARRGRSRAGQGRASVSSDTAPADQSTCGVGSSTCRVLGITPCRSAWTILITPPAPAAAEV
ncbi:hypothetical protein PICSAR252_01960 [Mycobacterium avium subsp. paratuberculosis]|nr:hypothetical protein PICSAR252_01960 [Mycobacterium avium subsp. paratuberculosis]